MFVINIKVEDKIEEKIIERLNEIVEIFKETKNMDEKEIENRIKKEIGIGNK